jgi:tRNA threonylcarbamoyladenosine biosynthesis protein TsaB
MNILAIDTCTEVASVTLYSSGIKTSRVLTNVEKSSGKILKLCDEVFQEAGKKLKEIDLIAYSKGPGAFTGVRMCIGVVQGLSLSYSIPTIGFSTLELLGFRASKILKLEKIAIALDARMGEVYWAVYDHGVISKMKICSPEDVDYLGADFVGVGTGWGAHYDKLHIASNVKVTDLTIYPESSELIDLSLLAIESGQNPTFELPQPIYLRNNVAKKSLK